MDEEAWFSVTAEEIAIHIASQLKDKGNIVDGFCGGAGNFIQFAKVCETSGHKAIGVELDEGR